MSKASLGVKEKMASINVNLVSSFSGMKIAKAFANENSEFDKFRESNSELKTSKTKFCKIMGYFNSAGVGLYKCLVSILASLKILM